MQPTPKKHVPNLAPAPEPEPGPSFLPGVLLTFAVLIFLAWEVHVLWQGHVNLERQFAQRESLVAQSKQVQNTLEKVATDIIALAATDPDARALAEKAGIRQNKPAAAPAP